MMDNEQERHDRESAESHQASVEIVDALAKMFAELKSNIIAKYSLEDEQVILLAIAKAAVKLAQIYAGGFSHAGSNREVGAKVAKYNAQRVHVRRGG